jgi:SAM-dependent methyltransferase
VEAENSTILQAHEPADALRGCPSCGAEGLQPFYRVKDVPAHSCLLMDSREDAVAYPRGRLDLSFCPACGFITNTSYDPGLKDYSSRYEETQHFSECFSRFARELAHRWVEQYKLQDKTILEIGCGKGEFLELLCAAGDNRGIGFDPGVHPERLSAESNSRIRFVSDYYSEKYRHETADVICCRHTLEHIHQTDELIAAIRANVGQREDVLLMFELPDTTRVLRECAFWDLYYEHCSYFTAGSLARLFRRNRFKLLELQRDYGDQYLLLVAQPSMDHTLPEFALEDDLEATADDVTRFRQVHTGIIHQWRERIQRWSAQQRRTVIWGGGSKGVAFLTTLGLQSEVDYVVDINPYKHGKFMPGTGHRVVGPDHLRSHRPDVVIVMNPIYTSEIRGTLTAMGVSAELVPV